MIVQTPHPVLPPFSDETLCGMVELIGAEATLEKIKAREALIETDALDPFRSQLEPDCWREADEMLHDPEVRIVALFGVNRGGKSWYAAKRLMQSAALCSMQWLGRTNNNKSNEHQSKNESDGSHQNGIRRRAREALGGVCRQNQRRGQHLRQGDAQRVRRNAGGQRGSARRVCAGQEILCGLHARRVKTGAQSAETLCAMREELGKDMNEYKRRLADYTATLDAWAEAEFSPNGQAQAQPPTATPERKGDDQ